LEKRVESKTRRLAAKNKKAEEFSSKQENLLAALDLNKEIQEGGGKLAKQINQQRKIKGPFKGKVGRRQKAPTWKTVIDERERFIVPLNLNIDLRRLTQLFGRSLYIKYFIKNID
jgi:hypothetical protein